ncbi:integrase, catalytic region, zinc finger, CCHC-type containing protein [Tanacetum coccineum]
MDPMISLGQKNTLAEYMILSGADNRPPMLDKDLYDSWKSRMELYMQNREHGIMILELVEHGPLIWPTVEENGVIKTKKYAELFTAEKIQDDCDMKATNIILQGLPADIYSLERECKLYDAFDKFTHIKGESLHTYYLRFTQLINDMNIYKMKMEQFQVNTKFLNSLLPEWTQFNHSSIPPSHTFQSQMNHQTSTVPQVIPQVAYQSPQAPTQLMTKSPFVDSCFVAPVFSPRDDLIACLNRAMAFLTAVASSRFPTTNNQLRTSSNPRNQATIQDGRVIVQQVQGRQGQNYSGTTYKGNATSSRGNTTSGQTRVVKCYNCQGEGHMARQCTQPKRPRNAAWYKEKAMLAEAQEAGQLLDKEQLAFLADPRILASQTQTVIHHNDAF